MRLNFILVIILLFGLSIGIVSAVDCGTIPSEDCTFASNTNYQFLTGTYYLNDTGSTGALRVIGSNTTIDCNGSTFIANNTNLARGIHVGSNSNNITIKNCNFKNYLYFISTGGNNNNLTILNVTGNNSDSGIFLSNAHYVNVSFSTIYGQNIKAKKNMRITSGSSFIYVSYNNFIGSERQIEAIDNTAHDIWIQFNNITGSDKGSDLEGVYNIYVLNNSIWNITAHLDGYDLGMQIGNCSHDCHIEGNNFSQIASGGVWFQKTKNSSVKNNYFSFIPMNQRQNYLATDDDERPCAIILSPIYKTYIGGGFVGMDNATELLNWISDNISISGNTFDSNTQCFIHNMGTTNLDNSDSYSAWYRKFESPVNILLPEDYYFNNNFNNISQFNASRVVTTFMRNTLRGSNGYEIMLQIFKEYSYFKNIHLTNVYNTNLFNLTDSITAYDNGTIIGLSGKNQNINLTLIPNQYVYVYNNYNFTCIELNNCPPQQVGQLTISMISLVTGIFTLALIVVFCLVTFYIFTQKSEGWALASFVYLILYFIVGLICIGILSQFFHNWLMKVVA